MKRDAWSEILSMVKGNCCGAALLSFPCDNCDDAAKLIGIHMGIVSSAIYSGTAK